MNINWRIYFLITILSFLFSAALVSQNTVKLRIDVTVPQGVDPNKVEVTIPPLKYNKKFVFSYTFDDIHATASSRAYPHINKKWVDDSDKFHINSTPTTGYMPEKTLGYTDGCGNEKRFALGFAIWPNWGNRIYDTFIENLSPDNPFLVWADLEPILDFDGSVYFHNMNERVWDKTNTESIILGLKEDQKRTIDVIGRGMKVLMRPDGNPKYVEASKLYEDIVMIGLEEWQKVYKYYPSAPTFDLTGAVQSRMYYTEENAANPTFYQYTIDSHDSDNSQWMHYFSHTGGDHVLKLFTRLNDEYGKDGDDSIWFATLDEVYEYWYMRKNCVLTKKVYGQKLRIEMEIPTQKYFYFTDFSLLLNGITDATSLTVSDNNNINIYGLSYAVNNNALLMNVDLNKSLLDKAEKYTAMYEKSKKEDARDDAVYFVSRLKNDLKNKYLPRLGLSTSDPKTEPSGVEVQTMLIAPNPSNGDFKILFELPAKETVLIELYSINGTLVKKLVSNEVMEKGKHELPYNLGLQQGVYIVRLKSNSLNEKQNIIISH